MTAIALTPRMKNWIEGLGVHLATGSKQIGVPPTIVVVPSCKVDGAVVKFSLTEAQAAQVAGNLSENDWVAIAPGGLGSVRAPYQFKGHGRLVGTELTVQVTEIYCTKPGPEAAVRLDTMGYEAMKDFEESRWKDMEPPKAG